MSEQLKIAQMNTKAVVQKLADQDKLIADQNAKIAKLEAKMVQLEQRVNQFASVQAQIAQLGNGPTVR